jgi:hypothetical protein
MSVMVTELYEALRAAGVEEGQARTAAHAVLAADAVSHLATKADIAELRLATKVDLAELKAELLKNNVVILIAMTAIYGGLVAALKVFA